MSKVSQFFRNIFKKNKSEPAAEKKSAVVAQPQGLDEASLAKIFTDAHTEHGFQNKAVDKALLEKAVELTLLGPTAYNCSPIRIVFVQSAQGKAKLEQALMEGNLAQTKSAPVTAIVCYDDKYTEQLPNLMPFVPNVKEMFENTPGLKDFAEKLNGNLQGAYFIFALRSLGLGVGPMSGFDNAKIDELFLSNTSLKSSFLINIGYGDESKRYPRAPRLPVNTASKWQ